MDEIRAKRLAKLAAPARSESATPATSKPEPIAASKTSLLQSEQVTQQNTKPTPSQTIQKEKKVELESAQEVWSKWISAEVEFILQVTLNVENENPDLTFLEATFTELVEENQDPVFNKVLLDRAIIERLSEIGHENPFRYLKDSWTRTQQAKRLIKQKDPQREHKFEILDEIDRLSSNYGLVSFQIPDFFANGNVTKFLKEIINNENSYSDFLIQIIKWANEEGTLIDFLNIFIPSLSKLILKIDLNYRQYPLILNIFQLLISEKAIAAIFTEIEGFHIQNESADPLNFEISTILGPIFRLSPLQDSVAVENFKSELTKIQINQTMQSLQSEHTVLLDRLFFIADKIIRGSEASRNGLLKYFATIVNKNHLRRGDHADFKKLSSNSFMTNITMILIRLSAPFLDQSFTKLDRIDIDFFGKSSLIDISDETRFNATVSDSTEYFDGVVTAKTNFISECFYLTATYLHYGIGGSLLFENRIAQQLKQLNGSIQRARESNNAQNAMVNRLMAFQLPKLEKQQSDLKAIKNSLVSFFTNKPLQLEVFDFIAGLSAFLTRAVDPNHSYPKSEIQLPLIPDIIGVENVDNTDYFREKSPAPFKYLPEYLLEGAVNYAKHVSRFVDNPLAGNPRLVTYVEFAVVFLRCPELIGNPHLKGRLLESLFFGSLSYQDDRPGYMIEIFDTDKIVLDNLLYALLDFYVVVEKTGSSSQFYDKFNSRYHISLILESLWKNTHYQNQLVYQSSYNEEFFIRFIARMLNDLTFLLDESLRQLSEVHSVQTELENRLKGVSNLEGTEQELQGRLTSAESQAKSNVQLANKSIDLFGLFTKEVPKAFVKPEIVSRLASMLDYNLEALVGPKCSELKVRSPEKYSFNPKELLSNISKVYVNLSKEEEFITAVSEDSRSFKRSHFTRAQNILSRWGLASDEFINDLSNFADAAETKKVETEEGELELGDVPDEFLDPLMFTLMKDPVTLPSSKVSIDRSTIRTHLLSDSTDPFNRMPLRLDDVLPDEELKRRIEEFKSKHKRAKDDEDATMNDV